MANRTASKNQWINQNLDRINLTIPKGQKQIIQSHATAYGESVNGFINRAIRETMDRDPKREKRTQQIAQIAVEQGLSAEEAEHEMEIEEALTILERTVPSIREFYHSDIQRQSALYRKFGKYR